MADTDTSILYGPIGIFDSGLGGLTILDGIRRLMPQYDYIYLGDNARAPYGTRSFDVVYQFTLQAVQKLFEMGCPLIILACNTASAKALRSIQQKYLPTHAPTHRVLGVIRPTAEVVGTLTRSRHIGILATEGPVLQLGDKETLPRHHSRRTGMPHVGSTGRKQRIRPSWSRLLRQGQHRPSPVCRPTHRHHHPRLHPLSAPTT